MGFYQPPQFGSNRPRFTGDEQGGVPPPFDPNSIAGLELWLDASDASTITLSGSDITQWDDKSDNAHILTPEGAGQEPSIVLAERNGRDVSRWINANSDAMQSAVNSGISGTNFAYTYFGVINLTTLVTFSTMLGLNPNDVNDGCAQQLGNIGGLARFETDQWNPRGQRTDNNFSLNTWFFIMIRCTDWALNPTTGTTFRVSGADEASSGYGGSGGGNLVDNNWILGNWLSSRVDMGWTGDIGEVLWYNTALSDANRDLVETYLSDRWGF